MWEAFAGLEPAVQCTAVVCAAVLVAVGLLLAAQVAVTVIDIERRPGTPEELGDRRVGGPDK